MPPRPSLSDIAKSLGVSSATVSNALSGKGRVSEQLSLQILDKAKELGYSPSRAARALSTGRSQMLGLVLADIGHPLFPQFAQAIERAATSAGYSVLIGDSRGDVKTQTAAIDQLIARGADGIILVPRHGTRVAEINHPIAVIDTPSTPGNTVSADHWQGGRLVGEHLHLLGHASIAVVGMHQDSSVQMDRIGGLREGFGGRERLHVIWIDELESTLGAGCDLGLADLAKSGVTAFACVSDIHALRVISELQRAGFAVPKDATVTGFDDLLWTRSIAPALTTVRMDMKTIARIAVNDVIRQIEPEVAHLPNQAVGSHASVPMQLIVRQSSAQPPGATSRLQDQKPVLDPVHSPPEKD